MASKIFQNLYAIISEHIQPVAIEHGFKKRGKYLFIRQRENRDLFDLLCVHGSYRLSSFEVAISAGSHAFNTMNAACDPWPHPFRQPKPYTRTLVGGNLGNLRQPPRFLDWPLSPDMDIAAAGRTAVQLLLQVGLPFIDRHQSLEDMMKTLETEFPGVSSTETLTVCWLVRGDHQKACAMAEEILKREEDKYQRLGPYHGQGQKPRVETAQRFLENVRKIPIT